MDKPIKLTLGQWEALRWLKSHPGLALPHTTNPPYCYKWDEHKPATVQSFYSLERRGLVERRNHDIFWYLTPEGEVLASGFMKTGNRPVGWR